MIFDKKNNVDFIEFFLVITIFVIPPIFNKKNPELIPKPADIAAFFLFLLQIVSHAGYEEILYRMYLPYRIKKITSKNTNYPLIEIIPIILFSLAHIYLGIINVVYAFFAGCIFRVFYLFLKRKTGITIAFMIVTLIHSLNNIISYWVFYY